MAKLTTIEFLASTTWICPAGVHLIFLQGVGGGGGGGGGMTSANNTAKKAGGGGGGGGATEEGVWIAVVPGTAYTITVGAGGSGGAFGLAPTAGGDGSDTVFTDGASLTVVFSGASGGGPAKDGAVSYGGTTIRGFPSIGRDGFHVPAPGVGGIGAYIGQAAWHSSYHWRGLAEAGTGGFGGSNGIANGGYQGGGGGGGGAWSNDDSNGAPGSAGFGGNGIGGAGTGAQIGAAGGNATGYGHGGGGGGGGGAAASGTAGIGAAGGSGAPGRLRIAFVD